MKLSVKVGIKCEGVRGSTREYEGVRERERERARGNEGIAKRVVKGWRESRGIARE